MSKPRHILLSGLAPYGTDAQVIRGIISHAREHEDWILVDSTHGHTRLETHVERLKPAGIIANITHVDIAQRIAKVKLPTVNVSGVMPSKLPYPYVVSDAEQVAKTAARYFVEKGFRNFAIEPSSDYGMESLRTTIQTFCSEIRSKGHSCWTLHEGAAGDARDSSIWDGCVVPPHGSIVDLPKPLAVFAAMDRLAAGISVACRRNGIVVPEQVAILGADDFDLLCEMSTPPLSSVRTAGRQIGSTAAMILSCLIRGDRLPRTAWLLPPMGVTTRRSSEITAVDDPVVSRAVAAIASSLNARPRVADIVGMVGTNRRDLERRFRAALGRTILDEIHQAMTARARILLEQTSDPIVEVARAAGFRNHDHMTAVFRRVFNKTPRTIRQEVRGKATGIP